MGVFLIVCGLSLLIYSFAYPTRTINRIDNVSNITRIAYEDRYQHYLYFSRSERLKYREKAREMFQFGYDSYMKYAFPQDELDPIHCRGRGPDVDRP